MASGSRLGGLCRQGWPLAALPCVGCPHCPLGGCRVRLAPSAAPSCRSPGHAVGGMEVALHPEGSVFLGA